jgi:hypothetical protein
MRTLFSKNTGQHFQPGFESALPFGLLSDGFASRLASSTVQGARKKIPWRVLDSVPQIFGLAMAKRKTTYSPAKMP